MSTYQFFDALQADNPTLYKFLESFNVQSKMGLPSAGNDLGTAFAFGTVGETHTCHGFIGNGDANDVYSFQLDTTSNFILGLENLSANVDVDLIGDFNNNGIFDADDELIASSVNPGTAAEAFDILLNSGTYFINIKHIDGDTSYDLSLSATPTAPPATDIYNQLKTPTDQIYIPVDSSRIHLNSVEFWNETMQQAVRNTKPGPTIASRAYGIVHTAMFDAWAAYDPTAIGTQLGDSLQRPLNENTLVNKNEAVSYAAYRTLIELFPTQVGLFDEAMKALGFDSSNTTADTSTPAGIGNVSAETLMQFRRNDGSNQLGNLSGTGVPYSDYTGYQPVNAPGDVVADPNRWQPLYTNLHDSSSPVQEFLTPQWGEVTPFGLDSSEQFRPPAPPAFGTPEYTRQVQQIIDFSANLTDEQKVIAEFWEDGSGTSFPPGTWMGFGRFVSQRDNHNINEDVKMFFTLGNAVMDAGISTWEAKRYYDYIRPISAVKVLYGDQQIQAWGGPGQGTQTIKGVDFHPYQNSIHATPPFAEYTSGHSSFSAAGAEILLRFTGSDEFGASFTQTAGSNRFDAGTSPSTDVTLSWPTFSAAADQSGMSRRYGGIHIEAGDINARISGRQVVAAVWDKAQSYINGVA
ncbi:MAG: phosphoesterase [Cyanobacteria bacterium J055]|nr:MAG: phosphoesterase [Cyanobacteria bacterium J055]